MSDFYDAFQELKGLKDATFSFDKPGILKLNTFLNMDDDEDNTLIVVDPDAETAEETQGKDYNGEVILKCDICGGLITKAPEDVVIDEEAQKANVEEECPYCFNAGGYDIVGEVKVPETLEYEEVDEFGDRGDETEDVDETVDVEESLNEAKNPKFIGKKGRPLTEDEIDKFVGVINSAVGQLSYKGYRRIFDVKSISVDESNNVEQKSPYADPYVKITLPTSTLGSRKFKNFYGDTIKDINNIIFNCRYREGYTEGTDEDLDEGQYAVKITTDGTKKGYKERADKKYRWEGTDFYLYDDTISEFESGIKNWIAKFIDEILGNSPKSFTSQPYYGEESAEYEEPSLQFTNEDLSEDYDKDAGTIAKFIEDAVNGLKNGEATNYRYKLDDRFAIFVGWSDGYSEDDETVIHNAENPTEGITAGIKVWTSDDMWTDFDYLNAPYYEGGEVLSDELSIDPEDDFAWLGAHFLNDYETDYRDLTVDEDGKVIEEKEEIEEDLSKDAVNIIGRKEAAKRFNKGEEIYVGLKGNKDLWGFVKDDETPTFKDVEDYVTDDGAVKASDIVYAVANTSKTESCSRKEKKSLKEEFSGGVLEFPSGDYVYVEVEDSKLVAGSATNTGIMHEYELDIEGKEPTDSELQELYEIIIKEHPEYEDEITESCKKGKRKLKEQISDSAYEVAEILEKEFGNKEKVSMDEFDRAFGRATKKVLGDKEPDEDFETDVRSILSMSGFETEFEGENEGGLSRLGESRKKGKKKKIDESVKIISTLDDYKPWSGAKYTYEAIVDAGKLDALDSYLEDIYPEGLTMTGLNDLLWFDGDSVLSDLGIYTEDAIDTVIQDAVDGAQGESFTSTGELESFLVNQIEDAMSGASVSVDISDEEVEITVENTTHSFALTDFTVGEMEESLKEAKEEVEDFYDVVYDTITGQKKIKGTSNPIRGCVNPDNMGIDRETGNMLAKCRTEKEADKVEKYVKEMFGDEGVTTTRKENKRDKDFPISIVINVPEERVIKNIEDKVVITDESLTESVEGVTVTTDTDVVNVDVTDTDGVTVDVQGKDSVDNTEEATIEPVSDETKEEIVANSEEGESEEGAEGEMLSDEFDEFNEEEFDELGESYLKEVYDNVKSFKTTRGVMDKDRIKLEGIIEFNSGKKAKTSFVFEKYMTTPRGKFKLLGENLQLTSRKNAFILTGSIQERKLCMEALTYKYTAKDAKGGKSKQVYGTKKVTK